VRRWAVLLHRRRRRVLWGGLAAVLVAGVLGVPVFGALGAGGDFNDPDAEAVRAAGAINDATGRDSAPDVVVLVRLGAPAGSPAAQRRIAAVAAALRDPGVAEVVRYRPGGDRRLVSRDGRSTYLLATYRVSEAGTTDRIAGRLEGRPGVVLGGGEFAVQQVGDQIS
jgi:hypothetical protein